MGRAENGQAGDGQSDTAQSEIRQAEIRQIMEILPHRYPLLLIDRITELEPMKRAVGYKNVTANEPVFAGHFPGNPVLPGVYIVEALAQLGGTVVLEPGAFTRRIAYLAGIEKFRFRQPVVPGDQLMMEAVVTRARTSIGFVKAEARVRGKLICSGELMFSVSANQVTFERLDAPVLHL